LFKLEIDDIKIIFEYDTPEEYDQYLKSALSAHKELQASKLQHYNIVQSSLSRMENKSINKVLKVEELWQKFVIQEKRAGKTSKQIEEYTPTYKKLVNYFTHNKNVFELTNEDIELYKEYLTNTVKVRNKHLSKATVNKNLTYLKAMLNSVKNKQLSELANDINLFSKRIIRKERPKRKNYTEEEINIILNYNYKDSINEAIIKIALYSGMRQGEIRLLTQDNIIQDKKTGIYYFDIVEAKSEAGVRQIPIHDNIIDLVLSLSFPLIPKYLDNKNAFGKKVRYALYKAVNAKNKTFHTLRANFIDNIIDNNMKTINPFALNIIKEIAGHAEGENNRLTLIVYKKGFRLTDKKDFIDTVLY